MLNGPENWLIFQKESSVVSVFNSSTFQPLSLSTFSVDAPADAEDELLTWRVGQRYTYRGRLNRYGGAILPISVDMGC